MEITKGEWYNNSLEGKIRSGDQGIILELVRGTKTDKEYEANAKLIAEAGTVYNETGYSPRELADQNKVRGRNNEAMIAILKMIQDKRNNQFWDAECCALLADAILEKLAIQKSTKQQLST